MTKRISQREARRLRKLVEELQSAERARVARYANDYPGGVNIQTVILPEAAFARLDVAQRLGFVLVAKCKGSNEVLVYAVRP